MAKNILQTPSGAFTLRPEGKTLCITGIRPAGDILQLPEEAKQVPITSVRLEAETVLPEVKTLILSENAAELLLSDFLFPSLEKILIPEGSPFSTDGKRILQDGRVLYTLIGPPEPEGTAGELLKEEAPPSPEGLVRKDVLYGLSRSLYCLSLPEKVKKLDAQAFSRHQPVQMISSALPSWQGIPSGKTGTGVQELYLTGPEARVNPEDYSSWPGLAGIWVSPSSLFHASEDGILYDKSRETLLWHPPCHPAGEFFIRGVRQIGERAFRRSRFLTSVTMDQGVTALGKDAFYGCERLSSVLFSDAIDVIPGSGKIGRYNLQGGCFADCPSLSRVRLPRFLRHLGTNAFRGSGLVSIDLPDSLEEIGREALACEGLARVTLPPSLQLIGKDALSHTRQVTAWEGTAKGLMQALGAGARIRVLSAGEEEAGLPEERYLLLPSLLPGKSVDSLLTALWDQGRVDYDAYARLLPYARTETERLEMALHLTLSLPARLAKPYHRLLAGKEKQLLSLLIDTQQLPLFSRLLREWHPSQGVLSSLLEKCNREGRIEYIALLLDAGGGQGKREGFSL